MRSKTSFFNRTIFMKNIFRFWPMWVLYLVVLFFMLPVSLYRNTNPRLLHVTNLEEVQFQSVVRISSYNMHANFIFVFVLAIIFTLLIFGYLYNAKNCNMIHALPVSRKELFVTGYLNAITFLVGPQVLMFLVSLVVCIMNRVTCVEYLFYWLIFSLIVSFLFASGAIFAAMLSGNVIAALSYYVAGNFIYIAARFLICAVISTVGYGMEDVIKWRLYDLGDIRDSILSPLVYLMTHVGIRMEADYNSAGSAAAQVAGTSSVVLYLIPAVLLLIFALVLYRKRQLECAGDIVAFRWMNPVFRWIIAFFAGVGLGLVFVGVFFSGDRHYALILILFSAVMTLIFFFLAEMILKKRFRIFGKKIWMESVICAAVMLFLTGAFKLDLFQVEKRIPDPAQVQTVLLQAPGYDMVLTDADKIEQLEEAHQSIIDHKKEYEDYVFDRYATEDSDTDEGISYYTLVYYLKNGRTLQRRYTIPTGSAYRQDPDSAVSRLDELQKDPAEFLKYMICENYEDVSYSEAYIDDPVYDETEGVVYINSLELGTEQAQVLYEAILRDLEEGNYPYYGSGYVAADEDGNEEYYNSISLVGRVKEAKSIYDKLPDTANTDWIASGSAAVEAEEQETPEGTYSVVYPNFHIYKSCTHTIQALMDLGVIQDQSDLVTWDQYNAMEEQAENWESTAGEAGTLY